MSTSANQPVHATWQSRLANALSLFKARQRWTPRRPTLVMEANDQGDRSLSFRDPQGRYHRLDGPADMYLGSDGYSMHEWFRHGGLHRDKGPASIHWSAAGDIETRIVWATSASVQRLDGVTYTLSSGGMQWWIEGTTVLAGAAVPDD